MKPEDIDSWGMKIKVYNSSDTDIPSDWLPIMTTKDIEKIKTIVFQLHSTLEWIIVNIGFGFWQLGLAFTTEVFFYKRDPNKEEEECLTQISKEKKL